MLIPDCVTHLFDAIALRVMINQGVLLQFRSPNLKDVAFRAHLVNSRLKIVTSSLSRFRRKDDADSFLSIVRVVESIVKSVKSALEAFSWPPISHGSKRTKNTANYCTHESLCSVLNKCQTAYLHIFAKQMAAENDEFAGVKVDIR